MSATIERVPHSIAVFGQVTAAGFPRRCQHATYRMTCADYDELEARADGHCEICGVECNSLRIDHDHSIGLHAVRGLLCAKCNTLMGRVDAGKQEPGERVARYVAHPFRTEWRPYPDYGRTVVDDWNAAHERAERDGDNLSEKIREFIRAYGKGEK